MTFIKWQRFNLIYEESAAEADVNPVDVMEQFVGAVHLSDH